MSRDVQRAELDELKAMAEERGFMRLIQKVPAPELTNTLHALGARKVVEAHAYDALRIALSLQEIRAEAFASGNQAAVRQCDRHMRKLQDRLRVLLPHGRA